MTSLASSTVTQSDGTTLITMTISWGASPSPLLGKYEVQFSENDGASWPIDVIVGPMATSFALIPAKQLTQYKGRVRAISQNGIAKSAWVITSTVLSPSAGGPPWVVVPLMAGWFMELGIPPAMRRPDLGAPREPFISSGPLTQAP